MSGWDLYVTRIQNDAGGSAVVDMVGLYELGTGTR